MLPPQATGYRATHPELLATEVLTPSAWLQAASTNYVEKPSLPVLDCHFLPQWLYSRNYAYASADVPLNTTPRPSFSTKPATAPPIDLRPTSARPPLLTRLPPDAMCVHG